MKEKENLNQKMSLAEYIEKNTVKPFNTKKAKNIIGLLTSLVGIIIGACLFLVTLKLFDIHEIAGYCGIGVSLIIYIILFIIPAYKINQSKSFEVRNIKYNNYRRAKIHNKELRNELAQNMIDLVAKTENTTWYDETKVGKLAIAKQSHDDEKVKEILTEIYNVDVKKATNKIISDHALKVGITTAISQSEVVDTAFITLFELEMIKEIITLYGYRPSDYELLKIYKGVITNALLAYGTQGMASSLIGKLGSVSSTIPVIGGLLETLAVSASQGLVNSLLTVIIGFQTKKYLINEYKLQETLDTLELSADDEACEQAIMNEVKMEVEKTALKKKAVK